MSSESQRDLVTITPHLLRADPARVVARTFIPGQELLTPGQSRASGVLERVLDMSEAEVEEEVQATLDAFGPRHPHLADALESRFELVEHRVKHAARPSRARRQLIGAYFTKEYSVEAAALFNPSIVADLDQDGVAPGAVRFVMSLRAVGEGHISSIEFRTGTIGADDTVTLDEPDGMCLAHPISPAYSKAVFLRQLEGLGVKRDIADEVLDAMGGTFGAADLDLAITRLHTQFLSRDFAPSVAGHMHWIAACNYGVEFPADSRVDQRVLMPTAPNESHGLEDLRMVRFEHEDGVVDYRGTYTAYDGTHIVPQLLITGDFRSFQMTQMSGPAARDKGMAIFPRKVGGRFAALSRWDRENNTIAVSEDCVHWEPAGILQTPRQPWEVIQVGNCGSPVETEEGWLVITHGVGPMREYSMGALLLDLEDPSIVLGALKRPLISPDPQHRDGYVPNVVYSCGGLLHGETLVLPYGCNDSTVRIALVDVQRLLAEMRA